MYMYICKLGGNSTVRDVVICNSLAKNGINVIELWWKDFKGVGIE